MAIPDSAHLTRAFIHLDRLSHNLQLLQGLVGDRPMWPAIKANAYGHGSEMVARHLLGLGYETLCVAHVDEAVSLREAGVRAKFLLLSPTLPAHAEAIVAHDCEPSVCTSEMLQALAREAAKRDKKLSIHLAVDTGMGRVGIQPSEVASFLEACQGFPRLRIRGVMSHFPRADEADKTFALAQIADFRRLTRVPEGEGVKFFHLANSAGILDLPDSYFDAVRPGIAIYGLRPSREIVNPLVDALQPVLEWKTRITFLKEVPSGTGLSYGHAFYTRRPSLIATVPVGYGDGLSRGLSNSLDMLVGGERCPQVGRITMDQSLLDVTALRGRVALGDEVVIIGAQGSNEVAADELAEKLGTINYEVVTAVARRVPRVLVAPCA